MYEDLDLWRGVDPTGKYNLVALLGEGSYGAVYRGELKVQEDVDEKDDGGDGTPEDSRKREKTVAMKTPISSSSERKDVAIKIIPDADDELSALCQEIRFLQDL